MNHECPFSPRVRPEYFPMQFKVVPYNKVKWDKAVQKILDKLDNEQL